MALAIKHTALGGLIYATMAMYLMAFAMSVLASAVKAPDRAPGRLDPVRVFAHVLFAAGFALAVATYVYRAADVRNMPLQNLFEVFLTLAVLIWPISVISRRFLGVAGQTADMFVAAVLCFPTGFVMDADISPAAPALQTALFVPHVGAYMFGTVILAKATIQAVGVLIHGDTVPGARLASRETATHRMVCMAFPLLTVGLLLGAVWGKYAWGDFWQWDPKEQWSLATWLVFVAYFHMRYMFGRKYPRLNAAWAITGMAVLVITLLWANLDKAFKGLHNYA